MDWKKLQNGSDIRGVALEGIEGEQVNLTADVVKTLAVAFVKWLKTETGLDHVSVAVGVDSRISGTALKTAFMEGVRLTGADVYDCGMASTPAMFMTTVDEERPVTAGVMVTASHLPFNRNGLKFFTRRGGLEKKDITAVLQLAEEVSLATLDGCGKMEEWQFMDTYCQHLVDYIRKGAGEDSEMQPLKGLRIVVDAGNGAGGFFADRVLEPLGADTSGSVCLEPDGMFPNHVPNPENEAAMQSIVKAVADSRADLGIIFDTDVDRSAIVNREGNPINRNALIALIAAVILREHPGSTVVTDSVTSEGLTAFISQLGGRHHRFKRGYKNVINEGIRLNGEGEECWLAIETSGHAALRENFFLDDGAFLIAKLLVEAARLKREGKELSDLISDLKQPAEDKEKRFAISGDDFGSYGQQVLNEFTDAIASEDGWEIVSPNFEGIRVRCTTHDEQGWFLLRLSLHDPVMVLNIESDVNGGVQHIECRLAELMRKFDRLK